MGDVMSSSTNSRPVYKQNQGSKAAIIRPVNRRDGTQSYIRVDNADGAVRPNLRALQLEDYVAQIRDTAGQQQELTAEAPLDAEVTAQPAETAEITADLLEDIIHQQQIATAELTHADHVDVLRAVAKLDAGYQWIAENNRVAASSAPDIGDSVANVETIEEATAQSTTQPLSQEMIHTIAAAIASVLTDVPESKLSQQIATGPAESPAPPAEEMLRLSPELPRQEFTLPVSEHTFVTRDLQQPIETPAETNTVSLTAAAWDVPAFRWPEVSSQILSVKGTLAGLAQNCKEMLSPFGKTIAVTAPARGQGTSTMAITIARLFATTGKKVLLVDADITNPGLSKTIGLAGVSWYRKQGSLEPIGECIIHGNESGVCVMPLNEPVANVAAKSAPIFDQLETHLDQVRSEFDLIVIDAGPAWQIVDEISSNSHLIDVAMLVNQDTQSNGFSEARERLMDRGIFKFIAAQNSFARRAG